MLVEYKQSYENAANRLIKGWKDIDKNTLCNLYIDNEDNKNLSEGYLAAIMVKYWSTFDIYCRSNHKIASPDEIYNWITTAILYVLKNKIWRDENSSIYGDPNGPDKAIHQKLKCIRLNYIKRMSIDKDRANTLTYSIDSLSEKYGDSSDAEINPALINQGAEEQIVSENIIDDIIKEYFVNKKYLQSFILYGIVYGKVFDETEDGLKFNIKKLASGLKRIFNNEEIADKLSNLFYENYNIEIDRVKSAINSCKRLTDNKIYDNIYVTFNEIKKGDLKNKLWVNY